MPTDDDQEKIIAELDHQQKKRKIRTVSVVIVSLIIVLLWGVAFRNRFVNFSWANTDQKQMIDKAYASWKMMDTINEQNLTKANEAKEEAREILTNIAEIIENNNTSTLAEEKSSTTTDQTNNVNTVQNNDGRLNTSTAIQ